MTDTTEAPARDWREELRSTRAALAAFVAELSITLTATPVPENPNMSGDMPVGSAHFHCKLSRPIGGDAAGATKTRELVTYYSVGPGIVESWAREHGPAMVHLRGTAESGEMFGRRADLVKHPRLQVSRDYLAAVADRYRPDVLDLLDCLASDACGMESSRTFEEWAGDYGYDTDSRKAERTYQACKRGALELESFLGRDVLARLLELERL